MSLNFFLTDYCKRYIHFITKKAIPNQKKNIKKIYMYKYNNKCLFLIMITKKN